MTTTLRPGQLNVVSLREEIAKAKANDNFILVRFHHAHGSAVYAVVSIDSVEITCNAFLQGSHGDWLKSGFHLTDAGVKNYNDTFGGGIHPNNYLMLEGVVDQKTVLKGN